ncbi:integrase [Rhodopirellula sp. SM50]|nr:integron integrase [Rhodopirellula sp. SM50]PAY18114.1 integrase [Rhodopirellula sp. SM50]
MARQNGSGAQRAGKSQRDGKPDWALIWHQKLAIFHGAGGDSNWCFGQAEVIEFLVDRKKKGAPTWKRLKIAEALSDYQKRFHCDSGERLDRIVAQLRYKASCERQAELSGPEIKELVGEIDSKEAPVIQQMRRTMRLNKLAWNTEKAYIGKLCDFFSYRGLWESVKDADASTQWGLGEIGPIDVEEFLTDMAVDRNVAESTQDQAFYAILYLFEHVLKRDLKCVDAIRSSKPQRIPVVMSHEEVASLLGELRGVYLLMAQLMYGAGLRLSECLSLRVKDLDFDQKMIIVCDSKGKKDRRVPLPEAAAPALRRQLESRKVLHERDLDEGAASVYLPRAIDRKYPNAHKELRWQYLFASRQRSRNPRSGRMHRHHMHEDTFPSQLKKAVERAGILKRITSHAFRHSFATHLLKDNTDIRVVQELLGHKDISTTMIYLHCLNDSEKEVVSPLDRLQEKQGTGSGTAKKQATNPPPAEPPRTDDVKPSRPDDSMESEMEDGGSTEHVKQSLLPENEPSDERTGDAPSGARTLIGRIGASLRAMLRRPPRTWRFFAGR